ncbi:MAG: ABC transporter permease [Thermoproteota archaeon]|nr:ABC transporter permease [Thermoproteota archaeon]
MSQKLIRLIRENKGGFIGVLLLFFLMIMTFYALFSVSTQSRLQWNDPMYWSDNPKTAAPEWFNIILKPFGHQLPEHKIFYQKDATVNSIDDADFKLENNTFSYQFDFNEFPPAFDIPYEITLGEIPPILEVYVKRPDNLEFRIYSNSLESVNSFQNNGDNAANDNDNNSTTPTLIDSNTVLGRVFSSSYDVRNSVADFGGIFKFPISGLSAEKIVYSKTDSNTLLNGKYEFVFSVYSFDGDTVLKNLKLVIQGKVYGLLGTDELRRDVFFGILIGTPVALFIGITVALSSSFIGLFYGLYSGYTGKKAGTLMLTVIDIFISLPTFIIFIIISIHFGRNLLFLIVLFILFGWPGVALLNRTFSIQIKNYPYVEASKLMGESDFKIVLRHIVPQLLPFTLANFALSVPIAILGESALSFLGFGDPSFPTWGQMLQEAHASSAETLGYWWWIVSPGLMISVTSIAFILIGRSLENLVKIGKRR